jgi:hypothetical protein
MNVRMRWLMAALIGLTITATAPLCQSGQESKPRVSKDDARLLESLLRDFLFDPMGAERVRVSVRLPWDEDQQPRDGWLVREKTCDRVYFTDGESMPAPATRTKIDFIAVCRKLYAQPPRHEPQLNRGFGIGRPAPAGAHQDEPTLVVAAWLYHLGQHDLAARALAHVPADRQGETELLRKHLAVRALHRMVECYEAYRDAEAITHGERLLATFPAEAAEFAQAQPLFNDLLRRKAGGGVFGVKGTDALPKGFADWTRDKRLRYLIDSLDETKDTAWELRRRQLARPGESVPPRLMALIQFGEGAVPALLDVLEKDERFTRCVSRPGKWQQIADVQTTRRLALDLLYAILRIHYLDPRDREAKEFYRTGSVDTAKAAREARAYWKEFGALTFEQRMMRVLTDPASNYPALREAAGNLAYDHDPPMHFHIITLKDRPPRPAILQFNRPTAAEAVLWAMDRDLTHDDTLQERDHHRASHEPWYMGCLIRLGDRRIAPELADRADHERVPQMRVQLAYAAHRLGESRALRTIADAFAAGKIDLSPKRDVSQSRWELETIIEYLGASGVPEADQALDKLGDPQHRYHDFTVKALVERHDVEYGTSGRLLEHPYAIRLIRRLLDDRAPTKLHQSIRDDGKAIGYSGGGSTGTTFVVPAILTDPAKRKKEAVLRRCDHAGLMANSVAGLPEFHPLLLDADGHLEAIRHVLD